MSDAIAVALIGAAVTVIGLIDRKGHREINRQFSEIRITLNGRLDQLLEAERRLAQQKKT